MVIQGEIEYLESAVMLFTNQAAIVHSSGNLNKSLQLKELQGQRSKGQSLKSEKDSLPRGPQTSIQPLVRSTNFSKTLKSELWQFCNPLSYRVSIHKLLFLF